MILNELPLFLYLLSFKDAKNRKIIWSELTFFVILQAELRLLSSLRGDYLSKFDCNCMRTVRSVYNENIFLICFSRLVFK